MKKFASRDIKIFLFGMLTMLLLLFIYEWRDFVDGFKAGIEGKPYSIESKK